MKDTPLRKQGRPRTRENVGGVRALERGLAVLEALSKVKELSLAELSRQTELPYSTTYRVLETLRQQEFVSQVQESGLYRIGVRAFEVGLAYLAGERLHEVAHPVMKTLVDDLHETVNLAILDGKEVVYVHQVEGQHMMRAFTQTGARAPLYCTGVGKALLAWQTQAEVRELLAAERFVAFTPNTVTNLEDLLQNLQTVRNQGYALDNEERELGVRCITAPIRNRSGEVMAALSLSAPSFRMSDKRVTELSQRIRTAADGIARRLGWRP